MWRDPRHNRWQQLVNRQAKRAAERDYYLARLARQQNPPPRLQGTVAGFKSWQPCDLGSCYLHRGHKGVCLR